MGVWAAPGVSKDTKRLNTALYGGTGELAHLDSTPSVLDTPVPFMKRGEERRGTERRGKNINFKMRMSVLHFLAQQNNQIKTKIQAARL